MNGNSQGKSKQTTYVGPITLGMLMDDEDGVDVGHGDHTLKANN
jgi:hypothetical protein